jgi:radical SAM protein with 4Fe4S-binding SPASM domain
VPPELPGGTMKRSLLVESAANSCYFRTTVGGDGRKALIQITERCNLHCAHCFVSAGDWGDHMDIDVLANTVLPRLLSARVERITLTGGEPFAHPDIIEICRLIAATGRPVGVCTNATLTSDTQIEELAALGNVHVNVSFDGFRPDSHGKFRGDRASFAITEQTTRKFAAAGLLQGLLSTPNTLTNLDDFTALARFAVELGAEYLLLNPLSNFGRGAKSKDRLRAGDEQMRLIRDAVTRQADGQLDLAFIRFPNNDMPLGGCDAGRIIYVFANGDVAVCPYLVFAARNAESRYAPEDFLVGNIMSSDIAARLADYDFHRRFQVGENATCSACSVGGECGKGCPAAVVADGGRIGELDHGQCTRDQYPPLLQIGRPPP